MTMYYVIPLGNFDRSDFFFRLCFGHYADILLLSTLSIPHVGLKLCKTSLREGKASCKCECTHVMLNCT